MGPRSSTLSKKADLVLRMKKRGLKREIMNINYHFNANEAHFDIDVVG